MKKTIVALHGFLGQGSDWDAVRAATKSGATWICPDLFAPGADSFAPPAIEGPCWLAGYSFGARLALRWMQEDPDRYLGALLLSVNPGNFQSDDQRASRRKADEAWAARFRQDAWNDLTNAWNAQEVFDGQASPERIEPDFDRPKLAMALTKFSVADQFTDPLRLPSRLTWLAGSRDTKFCALLDDMRNAGFPGSFLRIEGAGHRLLSEASEAVAAALDDLVA
ncbi:MAG: alpha/beta fold hydrolase [Chthoniobacterales bacterium]